MFMQDYHNSFRWNYKWFWCPLSLLGLQFLSGIKLQVSSFSPEVYCRSIRWNYRCFGLLFSELYGNTVKLLVESVCSCSHRFTVAVSGEAAGDWQVRMWTWAHALRHDAADGETAACRTRDMKVLFITLLKSNKHLHSSLYMLRSSSSFVRILLIGYMIWDAAQAHLVSVFILSACSITI